MMIPNPYVILIVVGVLVIGCRPSSDEKVDQLFTRMPSDITNVIFVNRNQENEQEHVLKYEYFYNGGGVALGDINNDGLLDIYLTANQDENKLYLNRGNFVFEDITEKAGVSCPGGWKTGVAMVDINGDGYLDIYVSRSAGQHPMDRENVLYINNNDLTFTDRAPEHGLNDDSYSTHAAFFDFDRDGDLDAFTLNHSLLRISNSFDISMANTTQRTRFVGNRFFINDNGIFRDVSDSVGVYGPASNYGLGVAFADINNDGWLDVYASNDYTGRDKLLINQKGIFKDVTDSLLTQISQFSMGVDMADVNNDGFDDIISLDMLPEGNKRQKELFWPDRYDLYDRMVKSGLHHQYMRNMLHLNNGNGTFSEIGQLAGISNTDWSWAALFADYDLDGYQDLFVSNGYKRDFTNIDFLKYKFDLALKVRQGKKIDRIEDILAEMPSNKPRNYIFKNVNGVFFNNKAEAWGLAEGIITNGSAYGDLDNDGDLDLVTNNLDAMAGIYRNNAERTGYQYLAVKLVGHDKNTFGVGAVVTIYIKSQLMKRTLCPYRGFQSSVESGLFFGLGESTMVDSLHIRWPRGEVQTLKNVQAGQALSVYQKDARFEVKEMVTSKPLFQQLSDVVNYMHDENDFIDFKVQALLPHAFSTEGPAMAAADINNDGLQDLYLGGAKGQAGKLFIQNKNGSYSEKKEVSFEINAESEETDVVFFDMDNDGDQDLYVVSGGYEFNVNDPLLQDHLYQNDGKGNFIAMRLPSFTISGSCVRPADLDNDGDLDLFIGGRVVPGRFPKTPSSVILQNEGQGNFTIVTNTVAPELEYVGMVTDATWVDLNDDRFQDLILVGEWMPVMVFLNESGKLKNRSSQFFKDQTEGWWNCILAVDVDKDGREDIIAGNYGLNNQFKPSRSRPMTLYYNDFDNNGSLDPIINYFIGEKSYPLPTRDELTDQVPLFKKRFPDYASYATATINDILTSEELKRSAVLMTYRFETTYFHNEGDHFVIKRLPYQAQFAPVMDIQSGDINLDGNTDLILGGNISKMGARFGKASGSFTTVLLGDGKGGFTNLPSLRSGLCVRADIRKMLWEKDRLVIAPNNDAILVYELSK